MKFRFHPATLMGWWMMFAVLIQGLSSVKLGMLLLLLLALIACYRPPQLFKLLRRTRWLLFSLVLIYVFATPGEPVWILPPLPSPTWEGFDEGVLQLLRFLAVLLSLSLLLASLTRELLILGLLYLLFPFKIIGLNTERLAVRLALTLHYAENSLHYSFQDWQQVMLHTLETPPSVATEIELPMRALSKIDLLSLGLCAVVFWVMSR